MTHPNPRPLPHLTRRGLLKASLLRATLPGMSWLDSAHAQALFPLDSQALLALAIKVTDALPASVCQQACAFVAGHVHPAEHANAIGIDSMLQLLHRDDVAHGRVHDLHGIHLSVTQIGVLAALRQKESA